MGKQVIKVTRTCDFRGMGFLPHKVYDHMNHLWKSPHEKATMMVDLYDSVYIIEYDADESVANQRSFDRQKIEGDRALDVSCGALHFLLDYRLITYSELAERLGLTESDLDMWKGKRGKPEKEHLQKLADVLRKEVCDRAFDFSEESEEELESPLGEIQIKGETLRDRRKNEQLNQTELAYRIGVTQSAVAMWETGKAVPSVENLKKLAKIFGCTVDELIDK